MNYVIDDEFDFFKELNNDISLKESDEKNKKMCMISHTPLTYNFIKLTCSHEFNYLSLYNELILTNGYNRNIKCPYCRTISDKLLPYIPLSGVQKKYGVNSPKSLCMDGPKCLYELKNGKNKGSVCGKSGVESKEGIFCKKHFDSICVIKDKKDKKDKVTKKPMTTIIWTVEKEDLFKRKSVSQLKELLKEKGMKTTGLKKELVNRIFIYNNANSNNNVNDMIILL